jgi:transcriptional/translational regulatory protein YebC/TACO1
MLRTTLHNSRHIFQGSPTFMVQAPMRQIRQFRMTETIQMGRRSAKIAGRKGKADAQKAKLYGKIGKLIAQAVRAGGADPIANSRLRDVLQQATVAQLPKDIIDRNMKKANDKNSADFSEMVYEAYGRFFFSIMIK